MRESLALNARAASSEEDEEVGNSSEDEAHYHPGKKTGKPNGGNL